MAHPAVFLLAEHDRTKGTAFLRLSGPFCAIGATRRRPRGALHPPQLPLLPDQADYGAYGYPSARKRSWSTCPSP
jgi:hypothetical protein